jgi:tRNA pseudouridine55 synthase
MTGEASVSGLLVVDKPSGCTSHDVVDRIRKVFGTSKVGHSGTLDPSATGVLLVGVGKATRLLTFLQNLPKQYRAHAKFGVSTSTQDADGAVISEHPCNFEISDIRAAAERFTGEIEQLPPMVSAVKVGGEPLYKAARRGEVVERQPRTVRVYALEVEDFDASEKVATIYVKCSSGTFVRTLASDIGDSLGCGAHLIDLRRLAIGSFSESEAVPLPRLEAMASDQAEARILSMREAMRDFPVRSVRGEELDSVAHGRELAYADPPRRPGELLVLSMKRPGDRPAHEAGMTAGIPVGILDPSGRLVAVYRKGPKGLKPAAVLL